MDWKTLSGHKWVRLPEIALGEEVRSRPGDEEEDSLRSDHARQLELVPKSRSSGRESAPTKIERLENQSRLRSAATGTKRRRDKMLPAQAFGGALWVSALT